ncbi:MAG: SDR family oxidoreductase [Anaerolineales bacterium]
MILVTGATGHIGNVLVRLLLQRGQRVRALVRPGKRPRPLEGLEVDLVPGDLLDRDSLVRALSGVETVYHLAARISLAPGPDPETERVNLQGTRHLLAAMRQAGTRRLVYASSIYAMRVPPVGVVDESCPFDPHHARGAYDRSKAAASLEVQRAAAQGLEAVLVCPTAVVGPYDFRPSEAGRGIRYNMTPGLKFLVDGAYDFVDVRDVAAGMLLAAERGRSGRVYILGGERLTVREVAQVVWEALGCARPSLEIPLWLAYLAAGFLQPVADFFGFDPLVTRYSLDAVTSNSHISHARAAAELGYRPRPARQAIRAAVAWFQEMDRLTERAEQPIRAAA